MIEKIIKGVLTLSLLFSCAGAHAQRDTSDMRNLSLPSRSRLASRAKFMTYPKAPADTASFAWSVYHASLDGEWRFRYFPNGRPVKGYNTVGFDDSGWSTLSVPCSWEDAGIVKATDVSSPYPFVRKGEKARLPKVLPVGVYRSTFVVPFDWNHRQKLLNIGRFGGAVTVWINGHKAGYAEGGSVGAEFDITDLCVEDVNTIVIENHLYAKGSLLEGSRTRRPDGLAGGVYIICQPKVRVSDIIAESTLDPTCTDGLLHIGVVVKSHYLNPKELKVYYECYDAQGRSIGRESKYTNLQMRLQDTVHFLLPIKEVCKWSDEDPYLYTVKIKTQRPDGRYSEYLTVPVGFRTVDVRRSELLVNGRPIEIRGVVMRDGGVCLDTLNNRLLRLKKIGVNAILTQPMMPEFYSLCDRYGFYVFDQAPVESTGAGESLTKGRSLGNDPAWVSSFVERAENMMQRDKLHPSVVAWSLGYRSGNGYNMYKSYLNLKAKDRTRPVCYGGAGLEWNTDLYCPVNPDLDKLVGWGNVGDVPCVIEEYRADIPTFDRVWDIVGRPGSKVQGGFMFDFDALDSNKQLKGAVFMRFAPVTLSLGPDETVVVTNKCKFLNLDRFHAKWRLTTEGGKKISEGELNESVAPGESAEIRLVKEKRTLPNQKLIFIMTLQKKDGLETVTRITMEF